MVLTDRNPTAADYVLGFAEFLDLIGVLAVAAWLKTRDFEQSTLAGAMDKFINKIVTEPTQSTKPFFAEGTAATGPALSQ